MSNIMARFRCSSFIFVSFQRRSVNIQLVMDGDPILVLRDHGVGIGDLFALWMIRKQHKDRPDLFPAVLTYQGFKKPDDPNPLTGSRTQEYPDKILPKCDAVALGTVILGLLEKNNRPLHQCETFPKVDQLEPAEFYFIDCDFTFIDFDLFTFLN